MPIVIILPADHTLDATVEATPAIFDGSQKSVWMKPVEIINCVMSSDGDIDTYFNRRGNGAYDAVYGGFKATGTAAVNTNGLDLKTQETDHGFGRYRITLRASGNQVIFGSFDDAALGTLNYAIHGEPYYNGAIYSFGVGNLRVQSVVESGINPADNANHIWEWWLDETNKRAIVTLDGKILYNGIVPSINFHRYWTGQAYVVNNDLYCKDFTAGFGSDTTSAASTFNIAVPAGQTWTFNLGSLVEASGAYLNLGGTYEYRFSKNGGTTYSSWQTAAWYAANSSNLICNTTHGLRGQFRLTNTAIQNKSLDRLTLTYTVERTSTPLYRSVGTSAANLNTGAKTVTIAGSTATFSAAMPLNIGVGDVLQYDIGGTKYLAFIHGRVNASTYAVKSKEGGQPQAAAAGQAVNIYRAYLSLANAASQTESTSIDVSVRNFDTSKDMVALDSRMIFACYADGNDDGYISFAAWTLNSTHCLTIYTPYETSEVGTSQRHNGTWNGGGYLHRKTSSSPGISLGDLDCVNIKGLRIESASSTVGVGIGGTGDNVVVDACLIKKTGSGNLTAFSFINSTNCKITNSAAINCDIGFNIGTLTSITVYNCVAYGCTTGFLSAANQMLCKNDISLACTTGYSGTFHASSTNNVAGVGVPPGANPATGTVAFNDAANGDYRLKINDTLAKQTGDPLNDDTVYPLYADILNRPRSLTAPSRGLYEYIEDIPFNEAARNTIIPGKVEINYEYLHLGEAAVGELAVSEPPASPVLTVVDNGDGTGAVGTVSGSDTGTTNYFYAALRGGEFTLLGSRSGDGNYNMSLAVGSWLAYVKSTLGGLDSYSNVFQFNVTNSTAKLTPEAAFRTLLENNSTVFGSVAGRIYPLAAPQKKTGQLAESKRPFIVYNLISSDSHQHLVRASGAAQSTIQVDVYADSYSETKQIAEYVRLAVNGYSGIVTYGGTGLNIGSILLSSSNDSYIPPSVGKDLVIYRVIQDYVIFHDEKFSVF